MAAGCPPGVDCLPLSSVSLNFMKPLLPLIVCILATATQMFAADTATDEQKLWERERAYWQYVEKNDLAAYANLWHEEFLGWPSISPAPVRKDRSEEHTSEL